jgi:hypothetical protein
MSAGAKYDLLSLPERGDKNSRWAVNRSYTGVEVQPRTAMTVAFQTLVSQFIDGLEPIEPQQKVVSLRKYVGHTDGTVEMIPAKPLVKVPTFKPLPNANKFVSAQDREGGSLLDRVIRGEVDADEATLWEAGRLAAEQTGMARDGQALLQWNRIVAVWIAARRGIVVSPLELMFRAG